MDENSGIKAVFKNSAWLIGESILTMLISLIVGVVSARFLGPNNYGVINRFLPYITLANSICTFGMQSIIVREISKNHDTNNVSKLLGSAIAFRLVLSVISIVIIDIYAFFVAQQESSILFWVSFLQSISLLFNSYEIITYFFHAELKSKYLAIATTFTSVFIGAWKVLLLILKAGVEYFAFSTTLQALLMFCFCFYFFKKKFGNKLIFSQSTLKMLIGDSWHLLLTSLGIAIYGQIDKIMIGSQLGNVQLGYYSAAYTIATMWYFLPQALSNSLRSKIFEKANTPKEYNEVSRILFLVTTILGISAGLAFTVLSGIVIHILYGTDYELATDALRILGWVGLFANLGTARSIWLVGKKLHRFMKWYTLMGAILNIFMNYFLIKIWGINGAAVSTVFSQFCVQFIFPLFFKETREVVYHMVCCFKSANKLKSFIKRLEK